MPPAYDLIVERGGSIVVETIEANNEDAAWRAGDARHQFPDGLGLQGRKRLLANAGLGFS